jgi:site-specific DNA-cytosine methylase
VYEFIRESRPYAFVIENVPRLRTVRGGAVFADLLSRVPDTYEVGM